MSKRAVFFLAGTISLALAWWYLSSGPDVEVGADSKSPPGVAIGVTAARLPGQNGGAPSLVTISDAMGLTLDASRLFELGFGGGLVVDRDTRAAIEALVNTMPAEPGAQDMERLEHTLRAGLPKEEAEKALKLITDYRGYTRDVQREMLPLGIPKTQEEARAFFDQMDALKQRHFDDSTANALFGSDERYARLAMEASLVQLDPRLTLEQKTQAVDALRAQLPADRQDLIPSPYPPSPDPAASQPPS